MTLLQSIGMIDVGQTAYAVILTALFAWRGPNFVLWVLLADFFALLAVLGAMDIGILVRDEVTDTATPALMIVWLASAVAFILRPGQLTIAMASLSAAAILVFIVTVGFDVQISTTAAIVNVIAFIQLAVAGFGSGNNGGGNSRGLRDMPDYLASSLRIDPMGERGMAQDRRHVSANSRGLK